MNHTSHHIPAATAAPVNLPSSPGPLGQAQVNLTPRTEAAPAPGVLLTYPDWPAVVESLIDVFARLHTACWPVQGASAPIAPAGGRTTDPTTLTDKEAFLVCVAGCERPGGPAWITASMGSWRRSWPCTCVCCSSTTAGCGWTR